MSGAGVAVLGAGGSVGRAVLEALAARGVPRTSVAAYAGADSAGETLDYGEGTVTVTGLAGFDPAAFAAVVDCLPAAAGRTWAERAAAAGAAVVCMAAAAPSAPLALPARGEGRAAAGTVVALPHPLAAALALVLAPLRELAGLEAIHVATYEAASGEGRAGVEELARQSALLLNGRPVPEPVVFPGRLAFNLLPLAGGAAASGWSGRERELAAAVVRLLGKEAPEPVVTAVQVPVFFGHGAAVYARTRRRSGAAEVAAALAAAPGLAFEAAAAPTPAGDALGGAAVHVGRLRVTADGTVALWLAVDNVRQVAEAAVDLVLPWADERP